MKSALLLAGSVLFIGVGDAQAQKAVSGKVSSGEAGYTIGCSAAASLGVRACGEKPSGKTKSDWSDAGSKRNMNRGVSNGPPAQGKAVP
jgi:hypothetical protein